jgi:hypothetical protein
MKNETQELYAQLSKLIEEYEEIKEIALQRITYFADKHGLIASVFDDPSECHAQYIPNRKFENINWKDTDQQDQFEYLAEQMDEDDLRGKWVTSSNFC